MPARTSTHPNPLVARAVRQARHRIANPGELSHLPPAERIHLFAMAWAVLKTAQGSLRIQRSLGATGGDAA